MADQLDPLRAPVIGVNGGIIPNARVHFYRSGMASYADIFEGPEDTAPQLPNPLTADANGRIPQVFFKASYSVRAVVRDANDVAVFEVDPCPRSTGAASAASDITFAPNENNDATTVQDAIENIDSKISDVSEVGTVGGTVLAAATKADARAAIGVSGADLASGSVGSLLFCSYTGAAPVLTGETVDTAASGVSLRAIGTGSATIPAALVPELSGKWICLGACEPNGQSLFSRFE